MGTGTSDIVQKSVAEGLAEPQFIQTEDFRTVIYRPGTSQVIPEITTEVRKLVLVLDGEKTRQEIQKLLALKDEKNFRENYQQKAINQQWIEMTIPGKPNSKTQKYRITVKGRALREELKKES